MPTPPILESVRDVERKLAIQHTKQIQAKQYAALRDIAISRHMGYMVRHEDTDIVGSCEKNPEHPYSHSSGPP